MLPLSKDANGNEIRNNYDVQVVPGTFTIGPAGSTVVPPRNPLLPPRSSLGAGMPAGATTPADAIAGVVTTMVGSQRAAAVAEQFGAVAGIILDEDVPMAASVSFDNEEPAVTRVGGEVIEDDATGSGRLRRAPLLGALGDAHWRSAHGGLRCRGSGEPPRLRPQD